MKVEPFYLKLQLILNLESVIFADIEKYSRMKDEKEVLFSVGIVFIITQVYYESLMNLWKVQITATNEESNQVNKYLKTIRKQMDEEYSPSILFGFLLWGDIGEDDKTEKYVLKSLSNDDEDIPSIYHQGGNIFFEKGELNMALEFYTQAYNLRSQRLPSDHPHIAASLNNTGL
ncbi:unnamed protein product [Didymodactylos carnosus]|uniref:Tetratricopeptide repeat protein n=1 Tax=Didymodactylos carnosus TaxID=1234261 RepID=A0A815ZZG2_9BILA|nr:unnamed protein product [Didymodactylos carnosus]CAF4460166.1 unnamed protein product [Didymodactylos carnosus]